MTRPTHTAVIGAGLAGLTCARALVDAGHSVVVFDKGRGLGGRMASRRKDDWRFDHGAVVLRPTSDAMTAFLERARADGHTASWQAAGGWVGSPGMSSVVKSVAEGLEIVSNQRVTRLHRTDAGWHLEGPEHAGNKYFDRVILAIPQPQAMELLAPWPTLSAQIAAADMAPCWTLMAGFDSGLPTEITYSNTVTAPLAVLSRDTAKPGRSVPGDAWVIQADADWTRAHLELEQAAVTPLLLAAFFDAIGCDPLVPTITMAHRWRYGLTSAPLGQPHVIDADLGLAVCGDWCLGSTAQAAFDSGRSLAAALLTE